MSVVLGVLVFVVAVALFASFVLPGAFVPWMWDLRGAGRLWWLPPSAKRVVRARWPTLAPHLHRPGSRDEP